MKSVMLHIKSMTRPIAIALVLFSYSVEAMIFKSEEVAAQWDTWAYYHEGTYYLYYLITEYSPGEGFGVATSKDGCTGTTVAGSCANPRKTTSIWAPVQCGSLRTLTRQANSSATIPNIETTPLEKERRTFYLPGPRICLTGPNMTIAPCSKSTLSIMQDMGDGTASLPSRAPKAGTGEHGRQQGKRSKARLESATPKMG